MEPRQHHVVAAKSGVKSKPSVRRLGTDQYKARRSMFESGPLPEAPARSTRSRSETDDDSPSQSRSNQNPEIVRQSNIDPTRNRSSVCDLKALFEEKFRKAHEEQVPLRKPRPRRRTDQQENSLEMRHPIDAIREEEAPSSVSPANSELEDHFRHFRGSLSSTGSPRNTQAVFRDQNHNIEFKNVPTEFAQVDVSQLASISPTAHRQSNSSPDKLLHEMRSLSLDRAYEEPNSPTQVSKSRSASVIQVNPVAKPPRTFEHDIYVKTKQMDQVNPPVDAVEQQRKVSTSEPDLSSLSGATSLVPDASSTESFAVEMRPPREPLEPRESMDYEGIHVYESVWRQTPSPVSPLPPNNLYPDYDAPPRQHRMVSTNSTSPRWDEGNIYESIDNVTPKETSPPERSSLHYAVSPIVPEPPKRDAAAAGAESSEYVVLQQGATSKKDMEEVQMKIDRAFTFLSKDKKPTKKRESSGSAAFAASSYDDLPHTDDSDSGVSPQEIAKRLKHVQTVSEKYSTTFHRREFMEKTYPQLFTYALCVGLKSAAPNSHKWEPVVLWKYPTQALDEDPAIPKFCFPDMETLSFDDLYKNSGYTYLFTLTRETGTRLYGFCRKAQIPSYTTHPVVFCIISPFDAFELYNKILDEVQKRGQRNGAKEAQEILMSAQSRVMPGPGKPIRIQLRNNEVLNIERPSDRRLETINCSCLMRTLSVENLVKVFSSALLERRILFFSKDLSVLSQTIAALFSVLYPFVWQHTYIPILPCELIDFVCAPTPFVIGALASCRHRIKDLPMDEVLIVDLDKGELEREQGDETTILPRRLQKAFISVLSALRPSPSPAKQGEDSLTLSEAFLRIFVETTHHYTQHILAYNQSAATFDYEGFAKAPHEKSTQVFLEWFTKTQMFEVFITERMENPAKRQGLFEERIMHYRNEIAHPKKLAKLFPNVKNIFQKRKKKNP